MYGFFDNVTKESVMNAESYRGQFDIGDNLAKIDLVEFKTSQSGNAMMVITFKKDGGETLKHYITDNDFKLGNLKVLSQCFNIPFGSVDYENWKGRSGVVVAKLGEPYNGVKYPKVDYLRPRDKDGKLPPLTRATPWEETPHGEKNDDGKKSVEPGYVTPKQEASYPNFDSDIPF